VTHVVVREDAPGHVERIVPTERVVETTADTIRLDCTLDELHAMREFLTVKYEEIQVPRYLSSDVGTPYYYADTEVVPITYELIPEGGRSVHPGTPVLASDGHVGDLDELVTDPETGRITHLVLREGHIWGKKKVLLPISMVEEATPEGTIRLHADKKAISALLAMPARQFYGVTDINLLVWTYDQADASKGAMKSVKHLSRQERGAILAAARLVKDAEGKTSMEEMGDVDKKHGALFGAVTGGLLALVGGPAGLAIGAAAGAVAGRAGAKWIDQGFPQEFLNGVAARLEAGKSAILALVEKGSVDTLMAALATTGGSCLQMPVTDEMLAQLAAEV
jgi:uncharacterized membrane protein